MYSWLSPSIPEVEIGLGKCEEESGEMTVNWHVFHPIYLPYKTGKVDEMQLHCTFAHWLR